MLKIGFLRVLAVLAFGIVIPYGLYRVSRAVGAPLMVAAAIALGLAYGAIKADNPWSGDGLAINLRLMGVSAAALAAYVGLSVAAARLVAKAVSR
jgi:hypothetical protein